MSGEHNHGGHFWVRHVSIAHSRSACGATRFLQELAPCSRLPCQSRRCGKVPPGRGSHMLFAGGRPRPDPACCCRLAFGRLLKRTVPVSAAHAPAKKRPRRGKRSLTLDATRSLPREDPPRRNIILLLLVLNCDGLFPDFEGLQGVLTCHLHNFRNRVMLSSFSVFRVLSTMKKEVPDRMRRAQRVNE